MKPIKDYPDYFITETGEVWSHRTSKLKRRKLHTGRGYAHVGLVKDGRERMFKVHRLVAEAYIPNPHNLPEVDHLDRNKFNNNVTNLEWVTHQENCERAGAKLHLVELVTTGEVIEVFNLKSWCKVNNVNHSNLYQTRKGTKQQSNGYILR